MPYGCVNFISFSDVTNSLDLNDIGTIIDELYATQKLSEKLSKKGNSTMKNEITENILLRAGFEYSTYSGVSFHLEKRDYEVYDIDIEKYKSIQNFNREWYYKVKSIKPSCHCAEADIQTIDHFNKLMELMDISFRLKE